MTEPPQIHRALQAIADLARSTGEAFFVGASRTLVELIGADAAFVHRVVPGPEPHLRTIGGWTDGRPAPERIFEARGTPSEVVLVRGSLTVVEGVRDRFPDGLAWPDAIGYAGIALADTRGHAVGELGVVSRRALSHVERIEEILQLFAVRVASELERLRHQDRFHDLFELAPDAIILVDSDGEIVLANLQAEALFGYPRTELTGMSVEQLMPAPQRAAHAGLRRQFLTAAAPRRMGARRGRLFAARRDGSVFPVDISLSLLRSDENTLIAAAIRDLTEHAKAEDERARLEQQLRQAQKLEAIGTLASGIAHDFNNILMAIVANLELLGMEVSPESGAHQLLGQIGCATDRAAGLVRQILDFSRKRKPRRTLVEVGPILDEVASLLRASLPPSIQLVTSAAERMHPVYADPTQLHQVVMNLATNAWHAIAERGRIELRAVDMPAGPERPRPAVRITVQDDGRGIPEAHLERIFEPFFTTKHGGDGSGLGLAVVHGIVVAHDGEISVESTVGLGTAFHVVLPAAETTAELPSPRGVPRPTRDPRGTILLVDDEELLVLAGAHNLRRHGFDVEGYSNPEEALRAVSEAPRRFDVVVTDYRMPGMTGVELASEIERIRPGIPIVLVSGNTMDFSDHPAPRLAKPYHTADLVAVVVELIGRAR